MTGCWIALWGLGFGVRRRRMLNLINNLRGRERWSIVWLIQQETISVNPHLTKNVFCQRIWNCSNKTWIWIQLLLFLFHSLESTPEDLLCSQFSCFKTFHVLLCLIVWVSVRQYFHLSGHTRDLVSSKALTVDTNDLPIFSSPSSWSLTLSNRYWSQEPGGQLLRLGRYCDQCLTSCLSTWPRPSRLPPLQPATETARGLNWWAGHTCLAITSHLISSMYVGNISKI